MTTFFYNRNKIDHMQLPRMKLVKIAEDFPHLINAKISGPIGDNYPSEIIIQTKPCVGNNLSISSHLQYKYQILVDGHVSAFSGAYWRLFSCCVMFKPISPWTQWYYQELRPYENYIPYQADTSDLVQNMQWAIEHDGEVFDIAQKAYQFANENLRHSDVMLYVYLLLNEYAKIQKFK